MVGDDFERNIYLIDRRTREMILLSAGHKPTAADHPHPTMSPDGTRIQIQSAMLSADGKSMNICIIPVPDEWLKRKYQGNKSRLHADSVCLFLCDFAPLRETKLFPAKAPSREEEHF